MNTSSTIITEYTMYMKTLPTSFDARANLCSLKKKIGEPAGTNISTIIYAYSSSGEAYRDRQLTTNFEL